MLICTFTHIAEGLTSLDSPERPIHLTILTLLIIGIVTWLISWHFNPRQRPTALGQDNSLPPLRLNYATARAIAALVLRYVRSSISSCGVIIYLYPLVLLRTALLAFTGRHSQCSAVGVNVSSFKCVHGTGLTK